MIGKNDLDIQDLYRILFLNEPVELCGEVLARVNDCYNFLVEFSHGKIIYGYNTGFGPMSQYKINDNDRTNLQYNLIRSHSSGSGKWIPDRFVRSILVARLNTLLLARSGVHSDAVKLLSNFINFEIYPVIYSHGSVGASGDLVQLAHIALSLIGEGEVSMKGEIMLTGQAMRLCNLKPMEPRGRDGLAVINGTSAMTGVGIINIINARSLLEWSVVASSMLNELVNSFDDHFSEGLNAAKRHSGQNEIARKMRELTRGSSMIKNRENSLYGKKFDDEKIDIRVQEIYSLRCVPQILGPVLDTISNAESVLINEINSVNDNPVIDYENKQIYHGGNFHGDYVSLEMDKLKIAVVKLSMLADRQLNFMMNDRLNNTFLPFMNLGKPGLNLGMQGAQFTAVSTTAENQMLANPMYVHSIPNNNDNQDIVSMGFNSAMMASKVIENSFEVLAIEFMALIQGIDYLDAKDKISGKLKIHYENMRKIVSEFTDDSSKYKEILKMKNFLMNNMADTDYYDN